MNAEGHKRKAEDIERSLQRLLPDPEGENVKAIVELTYWYITALYRLWNGDKT